MPYAEKTDRHGRQLLDISSILYTKHRLVFLDSPITDAVASEVIRQLLHLAGESTDDITLLINSPGGSVSAGLAIYDVMKGLPCDVATMCVGTAASMGAFLLASGTPGKRYVSPNCEVMIHQVMGGAQGQAVDIQIAARHISRVKERLNSLLAEFTGQPLPRIQEDTDRDYFMSAEEAVAYGMADGVRSGIL